MSRKLKFYNPNIPHPAHKYFRHKKKASQRLTFFLMAILERFERPTHSLEGCCSIQLSYRTMVYAYTKNYFNCQEKRTKFSFLSYKYSSIDFPKRKISSASDK